MEEINSYLSLKNRQTLVIWTLNVNVGYTNVLLVCQKIPNSYCNRRICVTQETFSSDLPNQEFRKNKYSLQSEQKHVFNLKNKI